MRSVVMRSVVMRSVVRRVLWWRRWLGSAWVARVLDDDAVQGWPYHSEV